MGRQQVDNGQTMARQQIDIEYTTVRQWVDNGQTMGIKIVQKLLIMRESVSGRSWTSKVFNTVITLDTYQFLSGAYANGLERFPFLLNDKQCRVVQVLGLLIHGP